MDMRTYLTPENEIYLAPRPREANHVCVPARPGDEHVYDRQAGAWVLPEVDLEEALDRAYSAISRAREAALDQVCLLWEGRAVAVDAASMGRMAATGFGVTAGTLDSVLWKTRDGWLSLDKNGFLAMAAAAVGLVESFFAVDRARRAEVQALDNGRAVLDWLAEPINLEAGWPGMEEGE